MVTNPFWSIPNENNVRRQDFLKTGCFRARTRERPRSRFLFSSKNSRTAKVTIFRAPPLHSSGQGIREWKMRVHLIFILLRTSPRRHRQRGPNPRQQLILGGRSGVGRSSDGRNEHSRIVLPPETGEQPSLSSGLSDAPWLNRRRPGSLYSIIEPPPPPPPPWLSGITNMVKTPAIYRLSPIHRLGEKKTSAELVA